MVKKAFAGGRSTKGFSPKERIEMNASLPVYISVCMTNNLERALAKLTKTCMNRLVHYKGGLFFKQQTATVLSIVKFLHHGSRTF